MINTNEFIETIQPNDIDDNFRIGKVTALFATVNTSKVLFDGEDIPSEKQYSYLASYTPIVNDKVLMAKVSGTYIILGKLNYNVSPSSGSKDLGLTSLTVSGSTKLGSYIGFFDRSPIGKQTVNAPVTVTCNQTPDTTYSSNEQTMLTQLKADVTNLRSTLNSLVYALHNYNLI